MNATVALKIKSIGFPAIFVLQHGCNHFEFPTSKEGVDAMCDHAFQIDVDKFVFLGSCNRPQDFGVEPEIMDYLEASEI